VRVSNLIKIFDNQSAIYDLGAQLRSVPARSMVMTGGAGDHGGTSEDPIHPKPSAGAVFALKQTETLLAIMSVEEGLDSNWDGATAEGKNSGPEARVSGETNLEDEFCMEEEAEEEAPVAAPKSGVCWRATIRSRLRISP
jgi:hypothetical protein